MDKRCEEVVSYFSQSGFQVLTDVVKLSKKSCQVAETLGMCIHDAMCRRCECYDNIDTL